MGPQEEWRVNNLTFARSGEISLESTNLTIDVKGIITSTNKEKVIFRSFPNDERDARPGSSTHQGSRDLLQGNLQVMGGLEEEEETVSRVLMAELVTSHYGCEPFPSRALLCRWQGKMEGRAEREDQAVPAKGTKGAG